MGSNTIKIQRLTLQVVAEFPGLTDEEYQLLVDAMPYFKGALSREGDRITFTPPEDLFLGDRAGAMATVCGALHQLSKKKTNEPPRFEIESPL